MKKIVAALLIILCSGNIYSQQTMVTSFIKGNFMDDYGIRYTINDSVWTQLPNIKYHIIKCNMKEQYVIARNDTANKNDKGLYTRIDFMAFENMAPYTWGFCLTEYDAADKESAETVTSADRKNPRKGCNGYPFSRMKKVE